MILLELRYLYIGFFLGDVYLVDIFFLFIYGFIKMYILGFLIYDFYFSKLIIKIF